MEANETTTAGKLEWLVCSATDDVGRQQKQSMVSAIITCLATSIFVEANETTTAAAEVE